MNISKRIVELRESKNMSTNKLANLAGISQSYLREIEMGSKNPTIEILSYICDALNISLNDFFSIEQSPLHPSLVNTLKCLSTKEQLLLADFLLELKNKSNN